MCSIIWVVRVRLVPWFKLAVLAAIMAVAAVVSATTGGHEFNLVTAQSSGVNSVARCGTGNPLDGRTQGVVDIIVNRLKDIGTLSATQTCNDVTNAHIANRFAFGTLDLQRIGLTRLRSGDFAGMSQTRTLDLKSNDLTLLPVGVFTGLDLLQNLDLRDNKLTTLRAGTLNGITFVRSIYLNDNAIQSLPADLFTGSALNWVYQIQLSGNELRSLPNTIFRGLNQLRLIYLDDNYITSDRLRFLAASIPNLSEVHLKNNLLTSDGTGPAADLPSNIFGAHPNLNRVYLNNNKIEELPLRVFALMRNVRYIDISDNRITRLQDGVFDGMTFYRYGATISLSRNLITELDAGVFNRGPCGAGSDPNCIRYINLDNNRIESLPAGLFTGLSALRDVRLDGNRLTTLPSGLFNGLSSFWTVRLSGNRLRSLPAGIFSAMYQVNSIELHNNAFTSILANVFDGLPKYGGGANAGRLQRPTEVTLYGNEMPTSQINAFKALFPPTATITIDRPIEPARVIPPDTGTREATANCGTGHTLIGRTREVVWRIMVTRFPSGPDSWPAFTAAYTGQPPSNWPTSFATWQNTQGTTPGPGDPPAIEPAYCNLMTDADLLRIRRLTFTNKMVSLESSDFRGMANLAYLDFDDRSGGHEIRELPAGVFDGLTNLRDLSISTNLLRSLRPEIFDQLTNLRTLDLSNNLLTGLPRSIFNSLTNLRSLRLDGNRLDNLPADLFAKLRDLRTLDLYDNELDAADIQHGTFNGLFKLRSLTLYRNNFRSLYAEVFTAQGLNRLKTLRIDDEQTGRASAEEFAWFAQALPSLVRLDRQPGRSGVRATPTPIIPAECNLDSVVHEPFISKIEPSISSVTITSGAELRLRFDVYNYRDALDNELFSHRSLCFLWSSPSGGSFSESAGAGVDRNGKIDDREVVWRAPDQPGQYIVAASMFPTAACIGHADACRADFNITVLGFASTFTPEPTPCRAIGPVPSSLPDTEGNVYSVFTPAEGGEFVGNGVRLTLPPGAVPGCTYIGLRAHPIPSATRSQYSVWSTDGMRYRVEAVDSSGVKMTRAIVSRPANMCVPLPQQFRSKLTGITLLRLVGEGAQPLTSNVRRHPTDGYALCGNVSSFPAVVVAANHSIGTGTDLPSPTPHAGTPDTGGGSPNGAYVLLALLLGAMTVLGAMRLLQSAQRVRRTSRVSRATNRGGNVQ